MPERNKTQPGKEALEDAAFMVVSVTFALCLGALALYGVYAYTSAFLPDEVAIAIPAVIFGSAFLLSVREHR